MLRLRHFVPGLADALRQRISLKVGLRHNDTKLFKAFRLTRPDRRKGCAGDILRHVVERRHVSRQPCDRQRHICGLILCKAERGAHGHEPSCGLFGSQLRHAETLNRGFCEFFNLAGHLAERGIDYVLHFLDVRSKADCLFAEVNQRIQSERKADGRCEVAKCALQVVQSVVDLFKRLLSFLAYLFKLVSEVFCGLCSPLHFRLDFLCTLRNAGSINTGIKDDATVCGHSITRLSCGVQILQEPRHVQDLAQVLRGKGRAAVQTTAVFPL